MQFNKITNPVYTAITNHSVNADGSITATYIVGTGSDESGEMQDFQKITETTMWIATEQANLILSTPLTNDDLGKTPNQIMLDRIYKHLKETNAIIV